ncbi:hypothetical protein Tco_0493428 [Tanacetum coccineum]
MSTLVFVDAESSTQADGAQSSRVPVPLPKDPYEAIRQAYLDETDTKSEPFKNPIDTETPESPLAIAPPIPLSEKVAAMSESAFRKRFRSSYESLPFVSPLDLLLRMRYHGTSKLVEDSKEDDDEEIDKSMDFDSVSDDAKDEGPIAEDEDPAADEEGLTTGVEGPGMDDKGYGLDNESHGIDEEGHSVESDGIGLEEEEEVVPGGQQQAALVVGMTMSTPLGLGYEALRRRELALEEGDVYSTFKVEQGSGSALESERPKRTPPLPEWTSGSLPISLSPSDDPSPISSPMIHLNVPSPIATPAAVENKGFLTELGAQVKMQEGLISDHAVGLEELSPNLFERQVRRMPREQPCGMPSVMYRERTRIYNYSLLRRDVHGLALVRLCRFEEWAGARGGE